MTSIDSTDWLYKGQNWELLVRQLAQDDILESQRHSWRCPGPAAQRTVESEEDVGSSQCPPDWATSVGAFPFLDTLLQSPT